MTMLHTAEIDMATLVAPINIATFLTNAAWAIRSTYYMVLKASPGTAIFGRDVLFDIPYIADWNKIGDYRQCQTDSSFMGASDMSPEFTVTFVTIITN